VSSLSRHRCAWEYIAFQITIASHIHKTIWQNVECSRIEEGGGGTMRGGRRKGERSGDGYGFAG
jgi:hypothetical protein